MISVILLLIRLVNSYSLCKPYIINLYTVTFLLLLANWYGYLLLDSNLIKEVTYLYSLDLYSYKLLLLIANYISILHLVNIPITKHMFKIASNMSLTLLLESIDYNDWMPLTLLLESIDDNDWWQVDMDDCILWISLD